jgi:SAM-dependent methyltransferase
VRTFAPEAVGIDLSAGMLKRSRERGYNVYQASATELPFDDRSFDLVYSFKVLPHIPELSKALEEVARVLDDGGIALLEFYNPNSLRGLWKRMRWWNVSVGKRSHDRQVYTVYHTPTEFQQQLPASLYPVAGYGAVVLTPHPMLHRLPLVAPILRGAENFIGRSPLAQWGGFYILVVEKQGGPR